MIDGSSAFGELCVSFCFFVNDRSLEFVQLPEMISLPKVKSGYDLHLSHQRFGLAEVLGESSVALHKPLIAVAWYAIRSHRSHQVVDSLRHVLVSPLLLREESPKGSYAVKAFASNDHHQPRPACNHTRIIGTLHKKARLLLLDSLSVHLAFLRNDSPLRDLAVVQIAVVPYPRPLPHD